MSIDLQAVSNTNTHQNATQVLSTKVKKVKKEIREFTKNVKHRVKNILNQNKENGIVLGALILLLLVGSLLTFVILKLVAVITWSWFLVLIPLYILALLFVFALIPSKPALTN